MNQDKRQQGSEFEKHQDQAAQQKPRPGERSNPSEQQSGQQHGGDHQQGGQGAPRDRGESGGKQQR